jgi:hypothetical protein
LLWSCCDELASTTSTSAGSSAQSRVYIFAAKKYTEVGKFAKEFSGEYTEVGKVRLLTCTVPEVSYPSPAGGNSGGSGHSTGSHCSLHTWGAVRFSGVA